ncbi:mucin-like protein [Chanodichthys erythropterus]|uniref:mucin-like protein n=1 Tax=Chanodichthys erythropterus TaxID=933992 RepID=UPI00351E2C4F
MKEIAGAGSQGTKFNCTNNTGSDYTDYFSINNTCTNNISINNTSPGKFYQFGSAAGDTEGFVNSSNYVAFSTPFVFFGRTYNHTYVNNNGLLTFNQPLPQSLPYYIPKYATEDFIAPLWTNLVSFGLGKYWYQQYTNGSVLTRATQDINRYFPQRGFTASWVFVATWDFAQTSNATIINHTAPAITFQVVLISGGGFSFILMNYGDCAGISSPVEAGFDTINSTDYYLIHYSTNGSYIPNLKNTTNVNVPGRWAFLVNRGSAPEIFYPFGSSGDTRNAADDDGSSSVIPLLSPFLFFGRRYQQIYVNNNGHLTFNQPSSQFVPYSLPAFDGQDIIAGLWTDLDNRARGVVSYHQYTNGSVLTRTTLDINNHFPNLTFNASWVFVATWDKVAYFPFSNTETSFQVVLISGSNFSFILMNYGDIAVTRLPVEAGYNTINSFNYFMIPGSNNGSFISNLKNSSNVNVPGRWAFRVDSGNSTSKKNVIGLRVRFSSVFDLTQYENITILQQIKQELVKYGLPRNIELKLRKLQKITP